MPASPPSTSADRATLLLAVARRDRQAWMVEPEVTTRITTRLDALAVDGHTLRTSNHNGIALFDLLTPRQLLGAMSIVASRPDLVCGAWIAPPINPRFASVRLMERARLSGIGFAIANDPHDGSALPVGALLSLHLTVLRARTPAQWAAADALFRHGSKVEAGRALGVTHQAVSKALKRGGIEATARTELALVALLDAAG